MSDIPDHLMAFRQFLLCIQARDSLRDINTSFKNAIVLITPHNVDVARSGGGTMIHLTSGLLACSFQHRSDRRGKSVAYLVIKFIRRLLVCGCNVNPVDIFMDTPLHRIGSMHEELSMPLATLLLSFGAQPFAVNHSGQMPGDNAIIWSPIIEERVPNLSFTRFMDDFRAARCPYRCTAIVMSQHPRLGAASGLNVLEPDTLQLVMKMLRLPSS